MASHPVDLNLQEINSFLNTLSYEQLGELIDLIWEKRKGMGRIREAAAMRQFMVGDRVYFTEKGRKIFGTITKLNQKTVGVQTDDHGRRRIGPSHLTVVIEQREERESTEATKTIQTSPSPPRNRPCPCGSGKKYKRCCE